LQRLQVIALGYSKTLLQRMLHIQYFEAPLSDIYFISGPKIRDDTVVPTS